MKSKTLADTHELKTIGDYIYGFKSFSQAQLYKGVGLEKTVGKLNRVYLTTIKDNIITDSEIVDNASNLKSLTEYFPNVFDIAVKQREAKSFKHPKQGYDILERPKPGVEYYIGIDGFNAKNSSHTT